MALQTEVWVQDIMENLYQSALYTTMSVDHSGYVTYKTVHIPNAGAKPGVVVNRSSLPATIAQRTDNDLTYNLAEFSTDPTLITNIDELQISYDKRMSVNYNNIQVLSETIGNYICNQWVSDPTGATRVVITSGAAVATSLSPSATGTRKQVALADISDLAKQLDNDLMPRENRYLLMPTAMFWELFTISEVVRASYNGFMVQPSVVASGTVAQLFGFNVMLRPTVNVWTKYTSGITGTLKAVGAAGAATDCYGCLAWHRSAVAKALGSVSVFSDSGDNGQGKPEYYGIILSSLVMMGGKYVRSDLKGVVNLVQCWVS